jgi:hypothetical protein
VALWFDLQLDAEVTISTAPSSAITAWDQGVVFFDQAIEVSAGDTLPVWCNHDRASVTVFADPERVAELPHRCWPRHRAPWAMGLRAEAARRTELTAELLQQLRAADPQQLERLWCELFVDDPSLAWLRRDLLADLWCQAGHEL